MTTELSPCDTVVGATLEKCGKIAGKRGWRIVCMQGDSDMRHSLRSRSILRFIATLVFPVLLTVGGSCNGPDVGSPYFPIPPPNPSFGPPTQAIDSDGVAHTYWKVTSPPSAELSHVYVYLTNIDRGSGTIVLAAQDGSYTTLVEGQQGDRIVFDFGALNNYTMCRPLREGVADTSCQ
jgi:hypothetical protein